MKDMDGEEEGRTAAPKRAKETESRRQAVAGGNRQLTTDRYRTVRVSTTLLEEQWEVEVENLSGLYLLVFCYATAMGLGSEVVKQHGWVKGRLTTTWLGEQRAPVKRRKSILLIRVDLSVAACTALHCPALPCLALSVYYTPFPQRSPKDE